MKPSIFAILLTLIFVPNAFALPAFPGAEGMGAATIGGRGGTVIKVTNLNDSGAGSFRAAVTTSGARVIVFTVSGIIDLQTNLTISNPYMTIAGQTSPNGIVVVGRPISIETHDIIVTHMRFRLGKHRIADGNDSEIARTVELNGGANSSDIPVYNIIFDHCSFSWGVDQTVSVHANVQDTTFSWCYVTSGLQNAGHPDGADHSTAFFLWGRHWTGVDADPHTSVSLHHSFLGYSQFRIPENNNYSFLDSVNNVIYYWNTNYTHWLDGLSTAPSTANIIGTYRKVNPSYPVRSAQVPDNTQNVYPAIYMYGVIDGYRTNQGMGQWSAQNYWHTEQSLSTNWQRGTPWPTTGYFGTAIPVTATTMDATYASSIISSAGATKCVSGTCRDGVDTTAASNYENATGAYTNGSQVDTIGEITTLINISTSGSAPTDSDGDGMSDAWETSTFGGLSQTDSGDYDSDGYTNIEEYLFYLGDYSGGSDTTPPTIAAFTMPSTASSLAVDVSSFTATDDTAVTGYCITTTNSSAGCSWSGSAPTTATASGAGSVTWYAWARDAALNVSNASTASTIITFPNIGLSSVSTGVLVGNMTVKSPAINLMITSTRN